MKKFAIWIIVGIVALSVLSFMFGGGSSQTNTSDDKATKQEQVLTKEEFAVYNNIFSDLAVLQQEYEDTYKELGYVGVYDDVDSEDFPKYGNITRRITSKRDEIPKINTSMADDERDLSMYLSSYATALIFLSAREEGIEGLDVANEEKETYEQMLNQAKDSHGF